MRPIIAEVIPRMSIQVAMPGVRTGRYIYVYIYIERKAESVRDSCGRVPDRAVHLSATTGAPQAKTTEFPTDPGIEIPNYISP